MGVRLNKVWSERPDHAIGEWNNVLMTTFRDALTIEALEAARIASHDLHRRWPRGVVVFSVVPHIVPFPTTEVRTKASAVIAETSGHVLCTATVICGTTLWVSAARAIVATINLLSRSPHPQKVSGKVDEAAQWAEQFLAGANATAAGLVEAVDLLLVRGVIAVPGSTAARDGSKP